MRIESIYRTTIALCLSLAILFLTVGSTAAAFDAANETLETRGPAYDGSDLGDILQNIAYGDGTTVTMNADKLATFYFDDDDNVTTEPLFKW